MFIVTARPYTFTVLQEDARALLREYPFLQSFSIGQSLAGRDLLTFSWGRGEKKIFINGAHHGMEWITSLFIMKILETLSHHYVNGTSVGEIDIRALYSKVTLVACPMVNPDGVNLAIRGLTEELPPITKTRLKAYNGDSTDFSKWQANLNGVDLNHNYDAAFAKGVFMQHQLKIFSPGPTRYSGSHPESEPEARAVANFTRLLLPDLVVAYHTQGEVIYYDFESKATDKAKAMAQTLSEISGYSLDQTEGMASYSGYKDWVIDRFAIPAFTVEAGLGENPLPLSQFEKIYEDNLPMLLYLMNV
ncbi:MAG: M14 family metallocarboxypeptidase [Clostridia bacterium]|nr:M14 family metallocarboxypeptidase [Clostridia bacterium]